MERKRFGEILVEAGVLTQPNLERALALQAKKGERLGKILEELELISEKDITLVLAHQYGLQAVSKLAERPVSESTLHLLDAQTALDRLVFPLRRTEKDLFLAVVNPADQDVFESLSHQLNLRIVPFLTTPTEIQSAVRRHYFGETVGALNERWRILLVGPDNMLAQEIRQALTAEGYELFVGEDLAEGLRAVLRHSPHLVLVDTAMTQMDGFEMVQILQSNDVTRKIPLIAVTGTPSLEEEVDLLDGGYFDYLGAPLPTARLLVRTKRALVVTYGKVDETLDV
ncbi:MAG: response regulator [Desulfuromonadales bacterium]